MQQNHELSPREREVVALVAEGKSNAQIALDTGLAEGTVKGHLESIFRKTGAASRTEAAVWPENGPLIRAKLTPPNNSAYGFSYHW